GWPGGTSVTLSTLRTGWASGTSVTLWALQTGWTGWSGRTFGTTRTGGALRPRLPGRTRHVPADVGLVLLAVLAGVHDAKVTLAGTVAGMDLVGVVAVREGACGQVGHEQKPKDSQRSDGEAALECSPQRWH